MPRKLTLLAFLSLFSNPALAEGDNITAANVNTFYQKCSENALTMDAIRYCLMEVSDNYMQSAYVAQSAAILKTGNIEALRELEYSQEIFLSYRSAACNFVSEANSDLGWTSSDMTTNCYTNLTRSRAEFLENKWLID